MPRKINLIDQQVGERIRERRQELGMTIEQLAAMLGVTPQKHAEFESGAERVGAVHLRRLSQALQRNIAYFFGEQALDDPLDEGLDYLEDARLLQQARKLLGIFLRVKDPATRDKIVNFAELLALAEDSSSQN